MAGEQYEPDAAQIAEWLGDYRGAVLPGRSARRAEPVRGRVLTEREHNRYVCFSCIWGTLGLLAIVLAPVASAAILATALLFLMLCGRWDKIKQSDVWLVPLRPGRPPVGALPRRRLSVNSEQVSCREHSTDKTIAWSDLVELTYLDGQAHLRSANGKVLVLPVCDEFRPALRVAERVVEQRREFDAQLLERMERGLSAPEQPEPDRGISVTERL